MKNNSIFNAQNDLFNSIFPQSDKSDPGSLEFKKQSNEPHGSFKSSLLIELIQRIDHSLESIKYFTQISRGKFRDKTFDDHFHHILNEEIGKVDLLLSSVLNYLKVNSTETKINTVHALIENALKKNQTQMEEKKIRVFKKFEEDLPETVTPDEHLRYILDSTLKYAIRWMPLNGGVGFMTRLFINQKGPGGGGASSIGEGKYIGISVLFDGYRKTIEPFETILKGPPPEKKETLDFELKLIDQMVKKNQGMMEFKIDAQKGRTLITLKFPVERRKVVYYPSIN
ncbi:MAG: hypothetical protein KGZ49_09585 [Syntrophaceae bacterium]|nr:hypothetical protein [Syntrophaceae bacterium]